jgi:small subunit ribosomal protein S6
MADTQAKKRLREYETIFLVKPDLTDDNVDKVKDRLKGIIDREAGKVLRFTIWGKKRVMYPIAKQPRAIFVHAHYLGGTKLVAEIERNLRNLDEVSRFLSVKIAEEVDPETRQTLEDVRMAGDVDDAKAPTLGAGPEREGGPGFGPGPRETFVRDDVVVPELEEEPGEEA